MRVRSSLAIVGEGRKRIRSARQGGCSKFKPSLIYRASLGPAKEPRTLFQWNNRAQQKARGTQQIPYLERCVNLWEFPTAEPPNPFPACPVLFCYPDAAVRELKWAKLTLNPQRFICLNLPSVSIKGMSHCTQVPSNFFKFFMEQK